VKRFSPAKAQRRKAKPQRLKAKAQRRRAEPQRLVRTLLCVLLCAFAPLREKNSLAQEAPRSDNQFEIKFDRGAIASLRRSDDRVNTDYIQSGRRLGNVFIRYRGKDGAWQSADTEQLANNGLGTFEASADGRVYTANYEILYAPASSNTGPNATRPAAVPVLGVQSRFTIDGPTVLWTLTIRNLGNAAREIDDLAIPLPIART